MKSGKTCHSIDDENSVYTIVFGCSPPRGKPLLCGEKVNDTQSAANLDIGIIYMHTHLKISETADTCMCLFGADMHDSKATSISLGSLSSGEKAHRKTKVDAVIDC